MLGDVKYNDSGSSQLAARGRPCSRLRVNLSQKVMQARYDEIEKISLQGLEARDRSLSTWLSFEIPSEDMCMLR